MIFWRRWAEERAQKARADAFVSALSAEPAPDDVAWLAATATGGDLDHARWELRYARRALGLLSAQRDALDDRTASLVARSLSEFLVHDPAIAPGKLRVVERQLNARLSAYGEALANREGAGAEWHLGRALLEFAGRRDASEDETVLRGAKLLIGYLGEANDALRESFGDAVPPEDPAGQVARAHRR
ncbi:MAG TPA: hypothetical protein VIQ74_01905 [Gemmatimonadaceae bacterium]|jgi:hypothetical protein